jgi:hypothetical protein
MTWCSWTPEVSGISKPFPVRLEGSFRLKT